MPNEFTLGALDNFDHSDKNSVSGLFSSHDTAMILCQTKPRKNTTKPSKSEVNLESIESISKLRCQEVTEFHSSKTIIFPHSFEFSRNLYPPESKYKEHCNTEFIISSIKSEFCHCKVIDDMPTWAAIKSLISDYDIPIIQVGFLPKPVTEHPTVYTAMINFAKVLEQLDQKPMSIFCDEGVYRIMVDIYIKCPEKFKALVPCLGSFHMGKCLEHCIGKHIKGTGLEDALIEYKVIGKKRLSKC